MALIGMTLESQVPNLPKKVIFCKKCVVSNQRPRIRFNEEQVCSACTYAHEKENVIDWREREKELLAVLDQHRSKDGSYDCIVPGSGGKDSDYVAHQLKFVYGMHPLTVTWAPHIYTDIGWQNYVSFKDSGFDNLLIFPNGILHRKLSRIAFEVLGDAFVPFIYGQRMISFHIAVRFGIPLIFFGENGEIEYGGSEVKKNNAWEEGSDNWNEFYFHGAGVRQLIGIGEKHGIFTPHELKHENFMFYEAPGGIL